MSRVPLIADIIASNRVLFASLDVSPSFEGAVVFIGKEPSEKKGMPVSHAIITHHHHTGRGSSDPTDRRSKPFECSCDQQNQGRRDSC